ncbi:MAG: TIGR00270 family protein [Candidatus Woesearchaeota archaeon]|nr:MAG: TIGR00270 family protein [Candidatus Woesearchaeota archaeon]
MAECEICGKSSYDLSYVKVEGTLFKVCLNCASLGNKVEGYVDKPMKKIPPSIKRREDNQVIVSDYGRRVSVGRQHAGLKQEDLAKKINERLSHIKAVESGKRTPSLKLARKLENALNIVLIERGEI